MDMPKAAKFFELLGYAIEADLLGIPSDDVEGFAKYFQEAWAKNHKDINSL